MYGRPNEDLGGFGEARAGLIFWPRVGDWTPSSDQSSWQRDCFEMHMDAYIKLRLPVYSLKMVSYCCDL